MLPAFIVECKAKCKLEYSESEVVILFCSKFSEPVVSRDGFVRRKESSLMRHTTAIFYGKVNHL